MSRCMKTRRFIYRNVPGVNVAPPGNDERVGGIALTLALEFPTPLGCLWINGTEQLLQI